ncbi:hypothetical protein Gp_3 [Bacillus phage vB_Bacillus_1020A]|nr:hypothetical protein Gp_3 [Bacillus phage vB_Bacillus_1020A]
MRLISCSVCFKLYPLKQTTIVSKKRVCHDCKSKQKEQEESFEIK